MRDIQREQDEDLPRHIEGRCSDTTSGRSSLSQTEQKGILRLNLFVEPATVDPQKAAGFGEIKVVMLNYQPLMSFDHQMRPIPGAAESVELSPDGLRYTFRLPAHAAYSDGSPLTAHDFAFAWLRLADPRVGSPYRSIGDGLIRGYQEYGQAQNDEERLRARADFGVQAVNEHTLWIDLIKPAPYFLNIAALWFGAPVQRAAVDVAEDWWYEPATYIGNGPFLLHEWKHHQHMKWLANPHWSLGPLRLQGLYLAMLNEEDAYQAYLQGELDQIAIPARAVEHIKSDASLQEQVVMMGGSGTFCLCFDTKQPPFHDRNLRQAIAQAIDRDAWVRTLWHNIGQPAYSLVAPHFPGHDETHYWPYNLDAAHRSLAAAGYPQEKKVDPIVWEFVVLAEKESIPYYEWLADQLRQHLDFTIELVPITQQEYKKRRHDGQETISPLFTINWYPDYPDPQNSLSLAFRTGGLISTMTQWSDSLFDALTMEADQELDETKRLTLYRQAQARLVEEAPVVFLNHSGAPALVKPYVHGITINTVTALDYFPGYFNLTQIEIDDDENRVKRER